MTPPLTIYCDRLTWTNSFSVGRALRAIDRTAALDVRVLDPMPAGWRGQIARGVLRAFGQSAREESFYAGHLRLPDGMPAQRAAADSAMRAALPESVRVVQASQLLEQLNGAWGRQTVRLHVCKSLAMSFGGEASLYGYALRVQTARALALRDGKQAVALVGTPRLFDAACLQSLAPEIRIDTYGALAALTAGKREVLKQVTRTVVRRVRGWCARILRRRSLTELKQAAWERTGLLLLQEDDLGLDRSFRSQPHWLLPEDPSPEFNTFVLAQGRVARADDEKASLRACRIRAVSEELLLALSASASATPTSRDARRAAWRCWLTALRSRSVVETMTLAVVSRLFVTAGELAGACRQLRVSAFLTAENYLVPADAMTLIGPALGVRTMSYQYSNLAVRSPLMMTTADVMFTFAPTYHRHWTDEGLRPGDFIDTGYPFDTAFARVRQRASAAKQRLRSAGATCILAYFDENFFSGTKYGLTTPEEHYAELKALLELVVRDPEIGVVTKVQFQRNAASRLAGLEPLVAEATATGRYLELVRGVHRNAVLPVEAALAADITIGHAIGSTASLEAALAGARSVMLNPYMMRDANHEQYLRADILLPGLPQALEAIGAFRRGQRPALGDWTPIIEHFDRYRDGRSAERVRAILEEAVGR